MPRARSSCAEPGCPRVAERAGRCAEHAPRPWADARSRAKRYGLPDGWTMQRLTRAVRVRDRNHCRLCAAFVPAGSDAVDHVMPRSRGGPTTEANLRLTCDPCHLAKTRRERARHDQGGVSPLEPLDRLIG